MQSKINIYDYEDLLLGKVPKEDLKNKTFCFSGLMRKSRVELETMAQSIGAYTKSTVTKKLNFLVVPDGSSHSLAEMSCKHLKAIEYNIKIIKESEFIKMVS